MTCNHLVTEIRYRVAVNGVKHYKEQCLICGRNVSVSIPHHKINNPATILPYDSSIYEAYRKAEDELKKEKRKQLLQAMQQAMQQNDKYAEYLQSKAWHEKRLKVLKRDNYTCKACEEKRATQVHHLTYTHIYDEPLFDLISVCRECHEKLHIS